MLEFYINHYTTLLIVYVIVVLLMGLWVIWDLVKSNKDQAEGSKTVFIDKDKDVWLLDANREWRKINEPFFKLSGLTHRDKDFEAYLSLYQFSRHKDRVGMTDEDWEHYWQNYY